MAGKNDESKVNMKSIVLLATAAIYSLSSILVFYDLSQPLERVISGTIHNTKYVIGFFYVPLIAGVLALGALFLKLRPGSRKLAQLCAQLGLLLSAGLTAWWLAFESKLFPTMIILIVIFLVVAINDLKENRRSSM